ncbi:flagellar basal-body rod protein FlgF [Magnetovirga frankeli]|uniref:flagellar basal-body rod protein FlgF n=1 Tax=Magnetovirga frankeli TaxID=947516 RepID=UPI00129340DA|nr:flagellar basal-body rod protein FlgF [gamma proteobacterium SS-5]
MDRMLYVAMSGAKETMLAQSANNNNLANASTTGFRADLQQFRSMPVFGNGHPTRVYAMSERPATDFTAGPLIQTGHDLDVAINGNGWIAVQAKDGTEAYTRAGDFRTDANGMLTTGTGLPVMGDGGPIAIPPADKVIIAADGTISIRPPGANPNELAVVERIKLVNPDLQQMKKGNDGLIRNNDGEPAEADANVRLVQGAIEGSNVNPAEALVDMIELSRRFELQVKMMKTADDNAERSAAIMRAT